MGNILTVLTDFAATVDGLLNKFAGLSGLDAGLVPDSTLLDVKEKAFAGLGIGLIDLSNDVGAPRYGSRLETKVFAVYSVAKLAAMYAAYQLRHDLRQLATVPTEATGAAPTTEVELMNSLETQWERGVLQSVKDITKTNKGSKLIHPPLVDDVFTFDYEGGVWDIDFIDSNESKAQLDSIDDLAYKRKGESEAQRKSRIAQLLDKLSKIGFLGRMRLMVGWSNDQAAASCIRDIGLTYIAAQLEKSGLYDTQKGGLWLGSDYDKTFTLDVTKTSSQAGTVKSLAAFMTLLAQGKLVDAEACAGMLEIMNGKQHQGWRYEESWIEDGLNGWDQNPRNPDLTELSYSKIGFIPGKEYSEVAWIVRKDGQISYIAVALGADGKNAIRQLAKILEAAIVPA